MARTTWKVLTLGAALTGLGVAGAGYALADDDTAHRDDLRPVTVSSAAGSVDPAPLAPAPVDASPESADSPFESPVDSAESPFDSPDDQDLTPDGDTPDDDGDDD
ncbi:hypothetical protein [Pseudonocardia nigra]|uniref:hypothetical protein n=1 Tax=Pseudonocardia nigra TaxID=1921578 RepID=UPI001C5CD7ED|nr:hypothetical protein [Pseudonocardia nigra]